MFRDFYINKFAGKCPLQMSCNSNAIFKNPLLKMSLKSENNESDDSNNDASKQTTPKEAQ